MTTNMQNSFEFSQTEENSNSLSHSLSLTRENSNKQENENSVLNNLNDSEGAEKEIINNSGAVEKNKPFINCKLKTEISVLCNSNSKCSENEQSKRDEKLSKAIVMSSQPLCADYRSDSDGESVDSESDSSATSTTSTDTSSDSESDDSHDSITIKSKREKQEKKEDNEFCLTDLPPIENLKITVPEGACIEIGTITSIIETLVVVESYKGTAALDTDTVLFLDHGKETLGKVFEVLGPITEPVYAVRFNSKEQIKDLNIQKNTKVYYAPKTEHTTYVFMSEVLKNKGSDASWKDNAEAPPEFQDFSDDEEERQYKNKNVKESHGENSYLTQQNKSRKRSFNKVKDSSGVFQGAGFRNPNFSHQRPNFHRNPSINQFTPSPPFPRSNFPNPVQIPPFPYNIPSYSFVSSFPASPHLVYPPRFSGPPFPTFGVHSFTNRGQNFQHSGYQPRMHAFPQSSGAWRRPPIRPPPPSEQGNGAGSTSEINP